MALAVACGGGKAEPSPAEHLAPFSAELPRYRHDVAPRALACPYVRGKVIAVDYIVYTDSDHAEEPAISAVTLALPPALRPAQPAEVGTVAQLYRKRELRAFETGGSDPQSHLAETVNVRLFDQMTGEEVGWTFINVGTRRRPDLDRQLSAELSGYLRSLPARVLDAPAAPPRVELGLGRIGVTSQPRTRLDVPGIARAALLEQLPPRLTGITWTADPPTDRTREGVARLALELGLRFERSKQYTSCEATVTVVEAGTPAGRAADPLAAVGGVAGPPRAQARGTGDKGVRACFDALLPEVVAKVPALVEGAGRAAARRFQEACRDDDRGG